MVGKRESSAISITEDMVTRYYELSRQAKEIDKQLNRLKKAFNDYFDETVGQGRKGELLLGDLKLQRQVRKSEKYIADKTVQKLEELNMTDCIQVVKRPDEQKITAAVTLGLLPAAALDDCKEEKVSVAIYVREV